MRIVFARSPVTAFLFMAALGVAILRLSSVPVAQPNTGRLYAPHANIDQQKVAAIPTAAERSSFLDVLFPGQREPIITLMRFYITPPALEGMEIEYADMYAPFVTAIGRRQGKIELQSNPVFRINRELAKALTSGSELSEGELKVARFIFIREAALALLLAAPEAHAADGYFDCAARQEPSQKCFDTLLGAHLMAAMQQLYYAKSHDLLNIYPEYISLAAKASEKKGDTAIEQTALLLYLFGGQLPNVFWAKTYNKYFDIPDSSFAGFIQSLRK
jgi:hypothetical protein